MSIMDIGILTGFAPDRKSLQKVDILSFSFSFHFIFKFVTFKTRVILCNTPKKEGRAFRNIGKYIPILFNQPCLFSSIIQLIAD